ncbi:MAG: hypothetical protein IIB40_00005 [Candidatus Marinimicrobia bacterium]|nr:hypothetical protein [Candidatus Neomarinimicrobiota bacterium]
MSFGDLDSVSTTSMQDWAFGTRSTTPEGKTEDLFKVESIQEDEVLWIPEWKRWNDLYRTIPEVTAPIDTTALWAVGMGWESKSKDILRKMRGNGLDIFDSIMMNMCKQYQICGDGFASIVKDARGRLLNLKPLNPGNIQIVGNNLGIIKRYEQISNVIDPTTNKAEVLETWQPDEMLHFSWNRIAMEIHGIPGPEKLNNQVKKINIAKDITSVIHRRHAIPVKIWEVDEDDPIKLTKFRKSVDNTYQFVENIIVPMGAAKATILQMQKGSIEEGISWIKSLQEEMTKASGVPSVTQGSESGSSEATSKILHLNFQPRASWHRRFIEAQLMAQLKIEIEFKEPPSIDPALLTDARKNTGDDVKDVNPAKNVR